ncbi:MAG: hypothetical protein ABR556_12310 [Pyrinomonadaceae bacterium]
MENHLTKVANDVVAFIAAAAAFMSVFAIPTVAQQQGQPVYVPPVLERREADMVNQREMRERESLRRRLGASSVRVTIPRYVQAVIAQVKEDFERIQVVRNEIVRVTSANNALDYKFISDATGEIRKRSSRLKNNLALADPEGEEKSQKNGGELDREQMKDALLMLCNRIESFVKSSIFETPRVLDVEVSAKANRDLENMIELSSNIRKSAQRLNNTPK